MDVVVVSTSQVLFYCSQDGFILFARLLQRIASVVLLLVWMSLEQSPRRPPVTTYGLRGKGLAQLTLRGVDALPMRFEHRLPSDVGQHTTNTL